MPKSFEKMKEIEESEEMFILAEDVGKAIGVAPQKIREQAKDELSKLGFPEQHSTDEVFWEHCDRYLNSIGLPFENEEYEDILNTESIKWKRYNTKRQNRRSSLSGRSLCQRHTRRWRLCFTFQTAEAEMKLKPRT